LKGGLQNLSGRFAQSTDEEVGKSKSDILEKAKKLINSGGISAEERQTVKELLKTKLETDVRRSRDEIFEVIPDISSLSYKAAYFTDSHDSEKLGSVDKDEARKAIRSHLAESQGEAILKLNDSSEARNAIMHEIEKFCLERGMTIIGMSDEESVKYLRDDVLDYSVITDFIYDSSSRGFEEIRVNDFNDIRVVVRGKEEKTSLSFESPSHAYSIAQKICRNCGVRVINKDNPFVRLRLGNNTRISMMSSPVARRSDSMGGVIQMVIRKQARNPFGKSFMVESGTICDKGYDFLFKLIKHGASVNFFGGTNSGKTAAISSFATGVFSESNRRVITIAEVDELNLRRDDELTGKSSSNSLMWEINEGFGYQRSVNASLTFTPETLILQETKGAEIVDVIDASITGHQVLTSSHAKNINVFAKRMLGMYKMSGSDISDELILEYIAEAFDIVVKMSIYSDGSRRISQISELLEYDRSNGRFMTSILYEYCLDFGNTNCGTHVFRNRISSRLRSDLMENGIAQIELMEIDSFFEGGD
jgi:pilus assembly protein CpaF